MTKQPNYGEHVLLVLGMALFYAAMGFLFWCIYFLVNECVQDSKTRQADAENQSNISMQPGVYLHFISRKLMIRTVQPIVTPGAADVVETDGLGTESEGKAAQDAEVVPEEEGEQLPNRFLRS